MNASVDLDQFEWLDADGSPTYDGWTEVVMASLSTDRRDPGQPAGERRGWWADSVDETQTGSLLWAVVDRQKLTRTTAPAVRDGGRKALQWLIDEGYATSVDVTVERANRGSLYMGIVVQRAHNPIELGVEV